MADYDDIACLKRERKYRKQRAASNWRGETCGKCGWIGNVSRIGKTAQYACDSSDCKRAWVENKSPACPAFVPRKVKS